MLSMTQNGQLLAQTPQSGTGQDIPVQGGAPVASFRSSVDLVRVSAVVRDRKGRFVRDLVVGDFNVLDNGQTRPITDFRHDVAGVSITVLFDVSGSMESRLTNAREAATHLFSWLDPERDEAAVFTFDTRLVQLTPFTRGLRSLPPELDLLTPFGATGLHDAIAQTARRLEGREGRRRAVVVLTDGVDNASRLSPSEVSGIASAIDVPVYVIASCRRLTTRRRTKRCRRRSNRRWSAHWPTLPSGLVVTRLSSAQRANAASWPARSSMS
jgi:VWFA-related protein